MLFETCYAVGGWSHCIMLVLIPLWGIMTVIALYGALLAVPNSNNGGDPDDI